MKDRFHGFRKFAFQLAFFIRKSGYLYFQHHLESKTQKKTELYKSKIRIFESVVSRAGQVKRIHNCLMQGTKRKYFIYHEQQAHYC